MIELTNLYMFIAASFLLCLAPGPDNIYVLTQGMTKSKKAAIITTLGLYIYTHSQMGMGG